MTTKVKRSLVKSFLNTGSLVTPTWSLIADGITTGAIAYAAKVTEETYLDQDNASISLDSYAPTLPLSGAAKLGDAVFTYLDAKRIARAIGGDAETEVVNVWLYKTPALSYYAAEKQSCSVQFNSFGGDGGQPVRIDYTVNYLGDPVVGEFNPTTLTFKAAPVLAELATMVIGAVTLTPLFSANHKWMHYAGSVTNGTTTVTMTSTCAAAGAVIVQKDNSGGTVGQGAAASLIVGVNHLTIQVTVGSEVVTYYIDITRAAA